MIKVVLYKIGLLYVLCHMLYVVILLLGGKKLGCFEGWHQVQIVLGSTHLVQQHLFSLCPSILTKSFFTFLGPNE